MANITKELNESYQLHITPEGETVVRKFYAIWDDVYGPTNVLPAIGSRIPEVIAPDRDDLKVVDIWANPEPNDLVGCRVEITYTNIFPELGQKNLPNNRRSWVERFYTQQEYRDVINLYDSSANKYTGTALEDTDANGDIIPVNVLSRVDWVYELTLTTDRVEMFEINRALRRVNSAQFFNSHREVNSTDPDVQDKEGAYVFLSDDTRQWRLDAAQVVRTGKDSYETVLLFAHNPDGWNASADEFYPEYDLKTLVAAAKQGFPPPSRPLART